MKWRKTAEARGLDELERAERRAHETLTGLPAGSRSPAIVAYAAAPAERLFRWYDEDPDRRPYSLTWRPVLDSVWDHLSGDESAYGRISRALGEFYLSPYSNNGLDGPDDLDQDEAAATYFTANCVVHGLVDFALLSAARATDHLDTVWYGHDDERLRAEIAAEVAQQASDLEVIAAAARANPHLDRGMPADLVARLRHG